MSDYRFLFEIFILIIIVILVFFLERLISSILKNKRLEDFSINGRTSDSNLEENLWGIVHKIGKVLNSVIFIEDISKKYEKYIKEGEETYKSPVDYITIKLLFAILMFLLYLIEVCIHGLKFSFIIGFFVLILGFLFPNLIFVLEDRRKRKYVSSDIVKCIIVMSNSFKVGRNTVQAIDDVIDKCSGAIKEEFIHVKYDVTHGLTFGDAVYRMYERVNDHDVLYLSYVLNSVNKNGVNVGVAFENVEDIIINNKKARDEINNIKRGNIIFRNIMAFIPLIFFLMVILLSKEYQLLVFDSCKSTKIIILELLTYVLYVSMISTLVRRK